MTIIINGYKCVVSKLCTYYFSTVLFTEKKIFWGFQIRGIPLLITNYDDLKLYFSTCLSGKIVFKTAPLNSFRILTYPALAQKLSFAL